MTVPTTVGRALLCDFASADQGGKPVLVGIYGGEIRFNEPPLSFPPLYLHASVHPNSREASFRVEFQNEAGVALVFSDINFRSKFEPSKDFIVNLNILIPPLKFEGPGTRRIVIKDADGVEIYEQLVRVEVGPPIDFDAEVSADINVLAQAED